MSDISVAGLYRTLVKSAAGFAVNQIEVGPMGPRLDRQWMVVDRQSRFVTQRSSRDRFNEGDRTLGIPEMCLVQTAVMGSKLVLTAPGMDSLSLPLAGSPGQELDVTVWASSCIGIDQGPEANRWWSTYLSRFYPGEYRLVRMPDDGQRLDDQSVANVAYADGYPFLVVSKESLADLNARIKANNPMAEPLGMDRFRPTIVLEGCEPYDEDNLKRIRIGEVLLEAQGPCRRCVITTTDPATGLSGHEPLRTLATYRRAATGGGALFGQNFSHLDRQGVIEVGAAVELL